MTDTTEHFAFRHKETKKFFDYAVLNVGKIRIWNDSLRHAKLYTSRWGEDARRDLMQTGTDPHEVEIVTVILMLKTVE